MIRKNMLLAALIPILVQNITAKSIDKSIPILEYINQVDVQQTKRLLGDNRTEDGNYDDEDGTDKYIKHKPRPKLKPTYENRNCLEKNNLISGVYPTVEKCADAMNSLGCKYIQYSTWNPEKECKCCREPEDGTGREHKHWDVYFIGKSGVPNTQGTRRACESNDPPGYEHPFKLDNYNGILS